VTDSVFMRESKNNIIWIGLEFGQFPLRADCTIGPHFVALVIALVFA
jgi:hypothetical protein